MARQVTWLRAARDDLESIAAFIAVDSPAYASSVVDRFLFASRALGTFPQSGRVVPEWGDETIRELFIYNYRLIYQVRADAARILAVIHGARMLPHDIRERET